VHGELVLQEKSILKTRPVLHMAVAAAQAPLSPATGTMVVADLGCSSGPNTFLVVSEVLAAVTADQSESDLRPPVHVQFFLNDLPGNDFNLVFQSLELFKKLASKENGDALPRYYVAGLPGSFYTRLFPDHCVHLFHSSYCLMWRSKVCTVPHAYAQLICGHFFFFSHGLI
jgi:anthranilate O-methyltransferase